MIIMITGCTNNFEPYRLFVLSHIFDFLNLLNTRLLSFISSLFRWSDFTRAFVKDSVLFGVVYMRSQGVVWREERLHKPDSRLRVFDARVGLLHQLFSYSDFFTMRADIRESGSFPYRYINTYTDFWPCMH